MPALIPMHNTLGALFIGAILSSILYGVTWLQVYSYYSGHCSRDRWPLKCFVAVLMLVDSANLLFIVYTIYQFGVTNFGDLSNAFKSLAWSLPVSTLSAAVLDISVQHFYAYRIYHLGGGSPVLPAAIVRLLSLFGAGAHSPLDASTSIFPIFARFCGRIQCRRPGAHTRSEHSLSGTFSPRLVIWAAITNCHSYQGFVIAELSLSFKVLSDILITSGMVYYLLSNRTQFRRTNNVLNLLAIYSINCGTLHLAFAISAVALMARYRDGLVYMPSLFIMYRLSLCAFMAILNSRDNLRETLDGQDGVVVATLTQLKAHTGRGTIVPSDTQDAMGASANVTVPKGLPPHSVYSDTSFSASVIAFDRERYSAFCRGDMSE
ncbi:hypothetical protein H4582DRAFT_1512047 [Lactarius indigo]|nr:hypothetical protein H4582DRAFT_1512047 [Lactarius indigo]